MVTLAMPMKPLPRPMASRRATAMGKLEEKPRRRPNNATLNIVSSKQGRRPHLLIDEPMRSW